MYCIDGLKKESIDLPQFAHGEIKSVKIQENIHGSLSKYHEIIGILVNRVVAATFSLNPYDLRARGRGTARVARARQVTAYLLHTEFSMNLSEVARFFSRDRTTIGHACRLVEDLRDNPVFDTRVRYCEETIELIKKLHCSRNLDRRDA